MIIYDFYIKGIAAFKAKTYSPLIVDADTPETLEIIAQSLKPVARRYSQVI